LFLNKILICLRHQKVVVFGDKKYSKHWHIANDNLSTYFNAVAYVDHDMVIVMSPDSNVRLSSAGTVRGTPFWKYNMLPPVLASITAVLTAGNQVLPTLVNVTAALLAIRPLAAESNVTD
jgi:hypothetical protein